MARSRKPRRPRPGDLESAPETRAVRLPPFEEHRRGEHQDHVAGRQPDADAIGEDSVTELTEDPDRPDLPALEQDAQKTEPRAQPHSHRVSRTRRRGGK
jgi:hypothetical protein